MISFKNICVLKLTALTILFSSFNAYGEGVLTRSERLKFCLKGVQCFSYNSNKDMQCNNDAAAKEAKVIEDCMAEKGFHSKDDNDENDLFTNPKSYNKEPENEE